MVKSAVELVTRPAWIGTAAVVLAIALAATFVRVQPPGLARVVRSDRALSVSLRRAGVAIPFRGEACFARQVSGRLMFEQTIDGGESPVKVSFAYRPPSLLPAVWPDGDWCASLSNVVAREVLIPDAEPAIANPRATETAIASRIQLVLANAGLQTSSVSARRQLPEGWERAQPVAEVAALAHTTPPVIFIGLDGADWQLLDDYMARGIMPNLARLAREGSRGVLDTEHPPLSPLLWTTMMTGVSPLEHQILDFTHFNAGGVKEPITSDERARPAIWNMATMAGKRVAVFGLWATYPAEPVNGVLVSDRILYKEATEPADLVYPRSRSAWAKEIKSSSHVDMSSVLGPRSSEVSGALSNPELQRVLVETEVIRRLALDTLAHTTPDLTIAYFQGTDEIGHLFAPYAPPKQPQVSDADYQRYHLVPELYFQRIDSLLGDFIREAQRTHAVLMLASDHGFRWREGRPTTSSVATGTAAKWHRNEGMYVIWPDVVSGPSVTNRSSVLGPRSSGARGDRTLRVLRTVDRGPRTEDRVRLLDRGPIPDRGPVHSIRDVCSMLQELAGLPRIDYGKWFKPWKPAAVAPANEQLAKLQALGYIGAGESTTRPAGETSSRTAGSFNNAGLILQHEKRFAEAISSFRDAVRIDPKLASAAWNLSELLLEQNDHSDESDSLLLEALQNGLEEGPAHVIARAIRYQRAGNSDRSLTLLEGAVSRRGNDADLRMFRGRYRIEKRDCAGALDDFRAAVEARPDAMGFASKGLAEMCMQQRDAARASFERSLQLDPNQPKLRALLGR